MSPFPNKTCCLALLFLYLSKLISLTNCLTLKVNDINDEYNEHCFYWMRTLGSVNLIFCNVEPEEKILKSSSGSICILVIKNKIHKPESSQFCQDFVIFTDTRESDSTEDCVSETIHMAQLTVYTKLIICDKSSVVPRRLQREESLKFLGSANALYVTRSDCWSAGPFFMLRRSFSSVAATDCTSSALWVSDTETLPDMRGETVRAVTFDRLLYSVIDKNQSNPAKRYDGIEINIFLQVAETLNFTWQMDEIGAEVSNKWGKLEQGRWVGGVLEAVTSGRADLMLAGFWLSEVAGVHFTYSWSSLTLVFLVPRPALLGNSWTNLARPFQGSLWLSVGVVVFSFPLIAWTVQRLYIMYHRDHRHLQPFSGYLLYTAGSLTGGSCALASPRAPAPLRPLVSSWYVVVLLLYAGYTSNIASILSIPAYEPPLDTVRQLVEQNFTWGRTYYVDSPTKFVNMEDYWQRRLVERYITYNTTEERNLLLGHKFALYAQVLEGTDHILVDSEIDDDLVQGLLLMKEGLRKYRITTATRAFTPLKHFYDRVIVRLFEHGFTHNFKAVALRKYQKSSYENLRDDPNPGLNSEPTVLTLDDFKYIFYILGTGWFLSSVCFVLELYV